MDRRSEGRGSSRAFGNSVTVLHKMEAYNPSLCRICFAAVSKWRQTSNQRAVTPHAWCALRVHTAYGQWRQSYEEYSPIGDEAQQSSFHTNVQDARDFWTLPLVPDPLLFIPESFECAFLWARSHASDCSRPWVHLTSPSRGVLLAHNSS